MFEFVFENFRGTTVTIGITGLPVTVTGEVVNSSDDEVIELRLQNGNKVSINAALIAFIF